MGERYVSGGLAVQSEQIDLVQTAGPDLEKDFALAGLRDRDVKIKPQGGTTILAPVQTGRAHGSGSQGHVLPSFSFLR
jgi:hypothetical protein